MFKNLKNFSLSRKIYLVVGLMAFLSAIELFTLMFAMNTLSSVRAFVLGEGLWSKAQKAAVLNIYQYALSRDEKYFQEFNKQLEIPAGDYLARQAFLNPNFNRELARQGFLQGGNHPDDIDGMIDLLIRFKKNPHLKAAIESWTKADELLNELRKTANELHTNFLNKNFNQTALNNILNKISILDSQLTTEENAFSYALSQGSRELEHLTFICLILLASTVGGTGIFLAYRFNKNMNHGLRKLINIANDTDSTNSQIANDLNSPHDELEQLSSTLSKLVAKHKQSELRLQKLNEDLEKRVEKRTQEIKKREAQLQFITNALPVFVAQFDRKERFLFANNAFCNFFNKSKEEIIGSFYKDVIGESRYQAVQRFITDIFKGNSASFERETNVDGVSTSYHCTLMPEINDNDEIVGFVLFAFDVTRYKTIEKELIEAKKAAETANAMKSTFLANMSHEIRTPVSAILGFSDLISDPNMSQIERNDHVGVIKRNGEHLLKIIDDILDLSKVEAGKLEIDKSKVNLDDFLNDLNSILNLKANDKGIDFNIIRQTNLPDFIITDATRLKQIILNVAGNAIKFTKRGKVEIEVSYLTDDQPKLDFIISDTGRGIHAEQVNKLFTPFTQADASTTRLFGGTGLGLALSKKLARFLDGDLYLLKSTPAVGSIFVVTINPGSCVQQPSSKNLDLKNISSKKLKISNYREEFMELNSQSYNINILLVEDNPDLQRLLRRVLEEEAGVSVEIANNGKEGVDKALEGKFDIVLMDLQMPIMDGYEAIKNLRANEFKIPVIALTAHATNEESRRCLEIGFDDHMSKPINFDLLLKSIYYHFPKNKYFTSNKSNLN